MRLPRFLHGRHEEVAARCESLIDRLAAGEPWPEPLGRELTDTGETPGLLVLDGPSPLLAGSIDFQCHLAHFQVRDAFGGGRLSAAVEAAVFAASLETAWGVLGLIAPANVMWVQASKRHRPLVEASLRHWPALSADDGRYSVGMPHGAPLWQVHNNLKHVLAILGVPIPALQAPLPAGGLAALVDRLDAGGR